MTKYILFQEFQAVWFLYLFDLDLPVFFNNIFLKKIAVEINF